VTRILAGTENGLFSVGDEGPVGLPGRRITGLVAESAELWAIADEIEVWTPGREGIWARAAVLTEYRASCLLVTNGGLLVGTSEAHLLRLGDGSIQPVNAFDSVPGRDEWYTPWGGPPDTRSMSQTVDGTVYANVHVGGIVRSRDDGASWEPTIDIHSDVHQVLVHEPSGQVLAACAGGLTVSDDAGHSWRYETEGLHATYSRAVAASEETVLLSVSQGPRGGRSAVYRRPRGGGPLVRCRQGLPEWFPDNINSYCLAAGAGLAALGTPDGSIFSSADDGATWTLAVSGLPSVECLVIDEERSAGG